MSKNAIEYLRHIQDECEYIISVIQEKQITKDSFLKDETLKRAIVRSLEIIGEATKKISVKGTSKNPIMIFNINFLLVMKSLHLLLIKKGIVLRLKFHTIIKKFDNALILYENLKRRNVDPLKFFKLE